MDKYSISTVEEVFMEEIRSFISEGRTAVFTPNGRSMLPFIRGGRDRVVLDAPGELEVGGIYLFQRGEKYILHRLEKIDGNNVTFRGDGNVRGVEHTTRDKVYARVTCIEKPDGRKVVPGNGRLWRRLLPVRRYLLYAMRKWDAIRGVK